MVKRKKNKHRRGAASLPKSQVTLQGMTGLTKASSWDHGPNTIAARHMTVVEERGEVDPDTGKIKNPNGVTGRRRIDQIEWLLGQDYLTDDQYKAAKALRVAWEKTLRSPPAIKEIQVDHTPKPDQFIEILIDRIGNYHKFARHIPSKYRAYIDHVVINNRPIGSMSGFRKVVYMERLRAGLDDLAERMGI